VSRSKPLAAIAVALTVAAFAVLPASAATAAPETGWVRVAHLSPDTKAVDLTLSSLSGKTVLYHLSNVAFGDVSPYVRLAPGTYAIAMVPAGSPSGTTPVVNASVSVTSGDAETVAAIGLNKDLKTKVIADSLTEPAAGSAKVRVVQASTKHTSVDVADGSKTLASSAAFGAVGAYQDVTAGAADLTISDGSTKTTSSQTFAAGSIHTLIVLDNAKGGLSLTTVLDSESAAVTPTGSIDTGAGGLARADESAMAAIATPAALLAALLAAVAAVGLARRPRGAGTPQV
jgi:Domain of unknown function (DUF4397)